MLFFLTLQDRDTGSTYIVCHHMEYYLTAASLSCVQALSIVKSNGDQVNLATCSYLWLEDGEQVPDSEIVACSRIGIGNYAKEWTDKPLRFYIRDCRCVSVRCKAAEEATSS